MTATAAAGTSGPAHKVQSAGAEYGFPHGHLGRLTESEVEQLDAFKKQLEEMGLYAPGSAPSHDDPTLLRYLRARRWVVEDACQQFKDTEEWRAANDVDVLYKTIDVGSYEMARKLYPQWTGRRDKRGIPLYVFEIRHLDSKSVNAYEKAADHIHSKARWDGKTPKGLLRLFALNENLTRFAQPLASQLQDRQVPDVPITSSTNVVDVEGVSLKQFWNLKGHMQAASALTTAHYPETLDRIFVVGAPYFFATVWSWVKRWFDPATVSKIFILGPHEVESVLSQFVDPENIPKKYGGKLDFSWGDHPILDPAADEAIRWCDDDDDDHAFADFPPGPLFWRDTADGDLECIAVGSVDEVDRVQRVCTIRKTCPSHPVPERRVRPGDGNDAAAANTMEEEGGAKKKTTETEIAGLDDDNNNNDNDNNNNNNTNMSDSGSNSTKELDEKVASEAIRAQAQQQAVVA